MTVSKIHTYWKHTRITYWQNIVKFVGNNSTEDCLSMRYQNFYSKWLRMHLPKQFGNWTAPGNSQFGLQHGWFNWMTIILYTYIAINIGARPGAQYKNQKVCRLKLHTHTKCLINRCTISRWISSPSNNSLMATQLNRIKHLC